MGPYDKIQTVWKRDPATSFQHLLEREWARPEFQLLQNIGWRFTEKVDGTNVRIMWDGGRVDFGGKTDNAQLHMGLVARLRELFPMETMARQFGESRACLYGEGFGAKIQKGGGLYRAGQDFILFDVRVGDWWLEWDNVCQVGESLDISIVPVVEMGTLNEAIEMSRAGFTSHCSDQPREAEGLVVRPVVDLFNRQGERVITKIKHRDFE